MAGKLIKATKRFSDRVGNYVRYRPGYPDEQLNYLIKKCGLDNQSSIADIGSGTGIFTKYLLDKNLSVTAVEPNDEMRNAADKLLSKYSTYSSIKGTAETTGLNTASFELLTVAQAFHWFDWPKAINEFKRVLKPRGQLALIWNRRNLLDPFQQAYEKMLREFAPEYNLVNHMNIEDEKLSALFDTNSYQHKTFQYSQIFSCDAFLGRMQSSSYSPAQGTDELAALNQAAIQLFETFAIEDSLSFEYSSHLYLGQPV